MSDRAIAVNVSGSARRSRWLSRTAGTFVFALIGLAALSIVLPFLWMATTAFKTPPEILHFPVVWIPQSWRAQNFHDALTAVPFGRYFANTAFVTGLAVLGDVISSIILGYLFAFLTFPWKRCFFGLLLVTMLIPREATLVPVYLIMRKLHLVDTYVPLIAPAYLGVHGLYAFIMRQFFLSLPRDLRNAALIDGCTEWQTLWRVMSPLAVPGIVAVAILSFVFNWTDFIYPLVFLNDSSKFTVSIGLHQFQTSYSGASNSGGNIPHPELLMAASLVVMLPTLMVFLVAQRFFVRGVAFTGLNQ